MANMRSLRNFLMASQTNLQSYAYKRYGVSHMNTPINGYQTIEFNTCDMLLPQPNRNCGGGVGIYIEEHLTYTKLGFPNTFVQGDF